MANDLTNSIMRTVSFVERIEVEFHGNIMTQTMVLADVDNDMANELIVGNIDGFVAIFKGESAQPWKKTTVNGMLTCLAVGKVHLSNKNSLVCMTAEGWCYIYNINSDSSSQINNSVEDDGESPSLKPVFTQELPANAKVMCLADIDSDGHIEMVIGYSDRVVRAFRWKDNPDSDGGQFVLIQRWQLAGQIGSITINYNKYHEPELMVSQPGATFVTLLLKPTFRQIKSDSYLDKMTGTKKDSSFERNGSFVSAGRADIIASKSDISSIHSDSMSNNLADSSQDLNRSDSMSQKQNSRMDQGDHNKSPEKPELKSKVSLTLDKLTSSPPAKTSFSSPDCSEHDKSDEKLNHIFDVKDSCEEEIFKPNLIYHPLAHMQARNKDTSTVIVGGINRERVSQSSSDSELHTTATYYALATLDGSLILVENDSILWSLQVDHYLFTLAKLDVTGNGQEEVVCCSWSGQTYIVNHSKEIVRYNFPDSVAAFCAGNYSLHGEDSNSPCFVYATFNNKIYIYPNLTLPRVESTNLLEVMQRRPGTRELLQKLNINADDHETLRKLYRYCLYGQHKKPKE
ncbi:KICSTOR complex protein ITFG2-like [Biomphalaria glabrata]|uniref:KICSTOR complex protein ITFG2-like n=1 Tax=Biomphalaria glabrata TaxID=6526 RepID=A0A9W3BMW3_BIOGL|nr:KICSTOR complex protein ITFG2-like [Biomphalaria glabrata]XP_013065638.2 KICSTOR complex protein ITFG2-like [Biomphalaria glabrata]XP_055900766.1 KICSTOR complex protein ITFG2-like [Biomphalaria glabrata]XP_055900767.1 KICSTOR complex protein ITFG2-like [Biomphalaria glabrata]XP_055900768.1 KICSTOR complex protein ITFG2-like [Biomphalaria glabrata]